MTTVESSKPTALSTLKSVLKRSSSKKEKNSNKSQIKNTPQSITSTVGMKPRGKNRVQFDESRNKYFEADYVILIHEEDYDYDDYYDEVSPFDEDDEEEEEAYDAVDNKICCSNPNCNNLVSVQKPDYSYSNYQDYLERNKIYSVTNTNSYSQQYGQQFVSDKKYRPPTDQSTKLICNNEKCMCKKSVFNFESSGLQYRYEPPQDFNDHVTLSPPEGYKDGLAHQCPHHGTFSYPHPHRTVEGRDVNDDRRIEEIVNNQSGQVLPMNRQEYSPETNEKDEIGDENEEEKNQQKFIVETITMTTVTERRIVREAGANKDASTEDVRDRGGRKTGILKGGMYWKNSLEKNPSRSVNYNKETDFHEDKQNIEEISTSFNENVDEDEEEIKKEVESILEKEEMNNDGMNRPNELNCVQENEEVMKGRQGETDENITSPDSTELTLTFKLGQHVLVANSLKPNSAVRQLFPGPRYMSPPPMNEEDPEDGEIDQPGAPKHFLVTAESLRLFEEAKKSKNLDENAGSAEDSQSFIAIMPPIDKTNVEETKLRKTMDRNMLRRSLIKYPCDFKSKKLKKKNENSLEERIKQLTCVDDDDEEQEKEMKEKNDVMTVRVSPQGEETKMDHLQVDTKSSRHNESVSPSSNSSSSSGSLSSTYKRITEIFSRNSNIQPSSMCLQDINSNMKTNEGHYQHLPYGIIYKQGVPDINTDIIIMPSELAANPHLCNRNISFASKSVVNRLSTVSDTRKQFLSTLAPLTACVAAEDGKDLFEHSINNGHMPQSRTSTSSSGEGSQEYSLDDIDDGLKTYSQKNSNVQPDVIAGTPQNETPADELALFVQQDAERIDKIKKRYSAAEEKSDDEDDYGFNKRPLVRGIKPRFGSTNEIFQQMQNRMKPPDTYATVNHLKWPYYSQENEHKRTEENSFSNFDASSNDHEGNANYLEISNSRNFNSLTNTVYNPVGQDVIDQMRYTIHSPPSVRHYLHNTPQPSPNPQETFDWRRCTPNLNENEDKDKEEHAVSSENVGVIRNPESVFYRRTVPNVHNPNVHMKVAPLNVNYPQQGNVNFPTASIRFSTTSTPPVIEDAKVIIEPHYSTLPHPRSSGTVGVIRVGQGQQMIRVPVPYPAGAPVQVHLMASRVGLPKSCDSPQRPSSPLQSQYVIATRGTRTQTGQIETAFFRIPSTRTITDNRNADGAPSDSDSVVDFEAQGRAIAEELQNRQKLGRSLSQDGSYLTNHLKLSQRSSSPNLSNAQERGVPEGAASTSTTCDNSASTANTVYYSMNV